MPTDPFWSVYCTFCADERCHAFHRRWGPTVDGVPDEVVEALDAAGWRLDDNGQWRCEEHAEVDA